MLNEFIKYLTEQIGQPYLWGGQHTKLTTDNYVEIIHKREDGRGKYADGTTYAEASIAFCKKKFDQGATVLYAYDCSGLASVADSPAGETVLTTYEFAANTNGDVTSSYSITKSTGRLLTLDSAYRYGKVVHMQITAASSSTASEGSNIATGTLNGAKPSVRVLAAAYYDNRIAIIMINTNGAITVRLSKGSMESSYTVTFGFTFICS